MVILNFKILDTLKYIIIHTIQFQFFLSAADRFTDQKLPRTEFLFNPFDPQKNLNGITIKPTLIATVLLFPGSYL